jgi:hypothetical protein
VCGLAAAALVLGLACGADTVAQPAATPAGVASESTSPGGDLAQVTFHECGDGVDGLLRRADDLTLTGEFAPGVDRGGDGTFAGTVTLTSTGPRITGVTSTQADVYVVRAGRIVAMPLPKDLIARPIDLAAGASAKLDARGSLRSCAAGAGAGEVLPAGRYDVFAVVVVNRDGEPTTSTVVVSGGPWPVELT